MEENDVHLRAAKETPGLDGAFGRVHETRVANFDAGAGEFFGDLGDIAFEAFLESSELRPVSVEADAKETDSERCIMFHSIILDKN
jgi:hypothetical protein